MEWSVVEPLHQPLRFELGRALWMRCLMCETQSALWRHALSQPLWIFVSHLLSCHNWLIHHCMKSQQGNPDHREFSVTQRVRPSNHSEYATPFVLYNKRSNYDTAFSSSWWCSFTSYSWARQLFKQCFGFFCGVSWIFIAFFQSNWNYNWQFVNKVNSIPCSKSLVIVSTVHELSWLQSTANFYHG